MKVIEGVNFPSYLFSSLIAGYVMMAVDMMLDGFFGLFGTYREYLDTVRQFELFDGYEGLAMAIGHTINSLVLALIFVNKRIYNKIPAKSGLIKGVIFGIVWHVCVLVVLLISSLGGAKFAVNMLSSSYTSQVSLFLLHIVWGGTLGLLYTPQEN